MVASVILMVGGVAPDDGLHFWH